jgi:hypothetical protein
VNVSGHDGSKSDRLCLYKDKPISISSSLLPLSVKKFDFTPIWVLQKRPGIHILLHLVAIVFRLLTQLKIGIVLNHSCSLAGRGSLARSSAQAVSWSSKEIIRSLLNIYTKYKTGKYHIQGMKKGELRDKCRRYSLVEAVKFLKRLKSQQNCHIVCTNLISQQDISNRLMLTSGRMR